MRFTPLPGPHGFGATCDGTLDAETLAALSADDRDALTAALDAHSLIVCRTAVPLEPAQLASFAQALLGEGALVDFSGTSADAANQGVGARGHAPGVPQVRVLGNTTDATGAASSLLCKLGYEWHSDAGSQTPGVYSILQCLSTPASGGETLFTSTARLYDALSVEQRSFAERATAVYSNRFTAGGPAAVDGALGLRMDGTGTRRVRAATSRRDGWSLNESRAPLVVTHPTSGKRVLVAGAKNLDHLVTEDGALTPEESTDQLGALLLTGLRPGDVTPLSADDDLLPTGKTTFAPEAVLEFRWDACTIVIWDNSALLHSTTPVALYGPGPRLFHHVIGTDVRRMGRAALSAGGGDYGSAQYSTFFLGSGDVTAPNVAQQLECTT